MDSQTEEKNWWELSYDIFATREEAEEIYNAFQALLCTCQHKEDDDCRVPLSGMHPLKEIPEE